LIALEPEAAAVFCTEKKLDDPASDKNVSVEGQISVPESHYMVVDIGGKCLANYADRDIQQDGEIAVIGKSIDILKNNTTLLSFKDMFRHP